MKWICGTSFGLLLVIQNVAIITYAKRIEYQRGGDDYSDYYGGDNRRLAFSGKNRHERDRYERQMLASATVDSYGAGDGDGDGDSDVSDMIDDTMMQCPPGCVCQLAQFKDLPISRWINYMQTRPTAAAKQLPRQRTAQETPIRRAAATSRKGSSSGGGGNSGTRTSLRGQTNAHDTIALRRDGPTDAAAHSRAVREIKPQHINYKSNYNRHHYSNNNNANNLIEVSYETEEHEHGGNAANEDDQQRNDDTVHNNKTASQFLISSHPSLTSADEDDEIENKKYNSYSFRGGSHKRSGNVNAARIKQATCILQEETIVAELVRNLPPDLQALILLYTGIGRNKTVNVSALKSLEELKTLEIRGQDRTLKLVFDEPLQHLQHANFESIELLRGDNFNRPRDVAHPSDSYNYKPNSEFTLNVFDGLRMGSAETTQNTTGSTGSEKRLDFLPAVKELEVLPYHVYMQRMKEARMPTFYGWSALQVLRIHACQLSELYWEMFDGLEALQHLSLERNDIEQLPPFALYGALHIKTLSLAHNRLRELHYRALAGLLELTWLDLSDNRLGWLSEKSFPPFPQLKRVDFTDNPIKFIYPAAFWVMNDTREMTFAAKDVALELWNDAPFGSLRQLRELHIGNISLTSLEQNVFKGLSNLRLLRLRGTVPSIEFDAFTGLTTLQELDLSHCAIHKLSMDAFIGCKRLEIINLAHNALTYMPPGVFDDQMQLREIYLEGNKLYKLPNNLLLLPHLQLARLNENPWVCTCDMQNWRPRITNQQRSSAVERCVTDFQTGTQIACKHIEDLQFNRSLAPRCENFNGRSVYYVLRKQLQCGPGRLLHAQNTAAVAPGNQQHTGTPQQLRRRQQKQRRNQAQQNTLHYVLHTNNNNNNHKRTSTKWHDVRISDNEISNNI